MKLPYFFIGLNTKKECNLNIDDQIWEMLNLQYQREFQTNNDNTNIIDGDTGTGKSNIATLICAAYSFKTGKEFNINHVFFDPDEMINYAVSTKEQIILWDEAAFAGLATEWQTGIQKKLMKMLMLCRKKKHFFVFCIPSFFKLKDYICLERSVALIHTYLRDGIQLGRYTYFRKANKEKLYDKWRKTGIKDYKNNFSFRGSFSQALPKILNEEEYDKKKDQAIMTIVDDDSDVKKTPDLRFKIGFLSQRFGLSDELVGEYLGIAVRTIQNYRKTARDRGFSLENGTLSMQNAKRYTKTKGIGSSWSGDDEVFEAEIENKIVNDQEAA